ncbi:MAG: GntR family transcriptional regulator [Rhodobacteraceae bacterium]|nr:GntR family transcriptional regulator [Paracoccaceae bacterium]
MNVSENDTGLTGWNLDVMAPIGPQLHRILRERIIRNDLRAGSQISESEIGRQYDVSRQPVREAFIKLAGEGLIAIRPQRTTIIRKIEYQAVLDARFIREAIEADIVRLLALSPDPVLIADLRKQLHNQTRIAQNEPENFIQSDEFFHKSLADGAGKIKVWGYIEGLKSQLNRVRHLSNGIFPVAEMIAQHQLVVDHIEKNDPDAAIAAMRFHLRRILEDLPNIREANPDLFDAPPGA